MKGRQCAVCKKFEEEVGALKLVKVPIICVETAEKDNQSESTFKNLWLCDNCNDIRVAIVNKK